MSASERSGSLTPLARLGFGRLTEAEVLLTELHDTAGIARERALEGAAQAADPDEALQALTRLARRDADGVRQAAERPRAWRVLWALLGASSGFGEFLLRRPAELAELADAGERLPTDDEMRASLLDAVGAVEGFAADGGETAWVALRARYRRILARIAAYDLLSVSPVDEIAAVSAALADAAGAALEASLAVARTRVSGGAAGAGLFPREHVAATKLAIIGMGKTGARELNYVSDVDVIYVAGADDPVIDELGESRVVDIATRLAVQTMRGISEIEVEP
jgi:glutamate-ammonia-ligase adenylyltransferase